jgi:hypothetical protein
VQERPPFAAQCVRDATGHDERLEHGQQLTAVEPAITPGAPDVRADVVGTANADVRPAGEQRPGFVGLVQRPVDDDWVGGRFEGLGQPARRPERCQSGQPFADERELEHLLAAPVGHRDTDRLPASQKRHGLPAQSAPA